MLTEFSKLFGYMQKLKTRYMNTLCAFKICDGFRILLAENKVGKKKSVENLRTLNDFVYFFSTIREACRCYFLIELAKFFDTSSQSLTVFKVLDYSEKNIEKLLTKDFLKYHKDREIHPMLWINYKPLSLSDIKKLRQKIDANKNIIKKLKNYRNKYLAHDDIKKIKVDLAKREIIKLLNLIKVFIELYELRLDFASTYYVNFEKEPLKEIQYLIECLQRHEEHRIQEIQEKYSALKKK